MVAMNTSRVPSLCRAAFIVVCAALFLVPDSEAEAQVSIGGFSVGSSRGLPGRNVIGPRNRGIQHRPGRRATIVPGGRRPDAGRTIDRRNVRRPDRGPRIKDARRPLPPCARPGTPRCPGAGRPGGQATLPVPPSRLPCRPGSRAGNCIDRIPPGRGRPDVVIPNFGPGDGGRYLGSLGRRQERTPPVIPAAVPNSPAARQILVLVSQTQPGNVEAQIASAYGLQAVSGSPIAVLDARAHVYRITDNRSTQSVIATLQSDPRIVLAQSNMTYQRQGAPIGTAAEQVIRAAQYGLDMIGIPRAQELATGRGVKVAVIDSGIDAEHPDLKDAIVETFDATGSTEPIPDAHGTAVAGIIRAKGTVLGVAPGATLLAARAFSGDPKRDTAESTSFILLKALDWSIGHGANVINLSFAGGRDPVLERIIAEANNRKVILVAAAGNGGPKAAPAYPAAYPQVIAVTAHDKADKLYQHANRGDYITVAAPGVEILVPIAKGSHMFMSGTSMSSAYVTGIIALMLERSPNLTPERARMILTETAGDLGKPGRDNEFGAGRVDAHAALEEIIKRASEIGAR